MAIFVQFTKIRFRVFALATLAVGRWPATGRTAPSLGLPVEIVANVNPPSGAFAFAATAAAARTEVAGVRWEENPDYGRGAATLGIYPVTVASVLSPAAAPQPEYPVYLPRSGSYQVTRVLGPVMDFVPDRGMQIAVSFDDQAPQVLDLFADREAETFLGRNWSGQSARDNARYLRSSHRLAAPGPHTLKIAKVDPGIVVQKIIISARPLPESYAGPTESVGHHEGGGATRAIDSPASLRS